MLESFAASAIMLYVFRGWVLGLRLLSLAAQTRELPELCLGLALFAIGGIGYPAAMTAGSAALQGTAWARAAFVVCTLSVHVGVFANLVFVRRVFRPESPAARFAVGAGGAVLLATSGSHVLAVLRGLPIEQFQAAIFAGSLGLLAMAVLANVWCAAEAFGYWAKLDRRARLGLADPVVTNRFLLWGLSSAAMLVGASVNLGFIAVTVRGVLEPVALLVTAASGFASSVALFLTFLPPERYLVWLRARAGGPSPA